MVERDVEVDLEPPDLPRPCDEDERREEFRDGEELRVAMFPT